jgi:hypothetical protein
MPTSSKSSGIRDNHYCGNVGDFLKPHIQDNSRLSVVSAYFTIYAYEALKDWLERIERMDFLFGEPTFVKSLDPAKTETKTFTAKKTDPAADTSGLEREIDERIYRLYGLTEDEIRLAEESMAR